MKKAILFIFFVALNIYCFAQSSNLTISTTGNTNLKIRLNGKRYSLSDRNVTFQNLQAGTYPLVIYQLQKKSNGATEFVEVFNNNITLTYQKHLEVTVLRFGKTAWDESAIVADDWNDGYVNPVGNNNTGNSAPSIDDATFQLMKKRIKDAYYDSEMLTTGKAVIRNNLLSCKQIIELCKLFSYDDGKLNLAKYAYDFCTDKGSFFTVADVFYYDSYKKDLMTFISNK